MKRTTQSLFLLSAASSTFFHTLAFVPQQASFPTRMPLSTPPLPAPLFAATTEEETIVPSNTNIMINGAVVGTIATAVGYTLLHTDVEALQALWEYDLGIVHGDLTKATVALDLLARLPRDWIASYEALVPLHPIFYKACTSGCAYALGDFVSQLLQGRTLATLDLPRSLRSGAAGFIGHGPLCHYWLQAMEHYLDFGGAWWATGIKVTADLTVWSVFLNAAYSFLIGTLALRPPSQVWSEVKATSWPALRSAWRFWPFVHTISFSHAVPMDLKLLWVDVMEVVWVTILSKVANEDRQRAEQAAAAGVVETTVKEPKEDSLREVPQKVLAACWPLIAMWPVLYAGYQVEQMLGLMPSS